MINKKISLRAIEEEDLELIREWNFSPETSRYFPQRWPINKIEQKRWFDNQANSTDKKKLLIINDNTNAPIGIVSIMQIDHINSNCEIGITIGNTECQGKGFATGAIYLLLHKLFHSFNMNLVYIKTLDNNTQAVNLFSKCGFKKNGVLREMLFHEGEYHSWIWMSITKLEWSDMYRGTRS